MDDLVQAIVADDIEEEEARTFIDELIDNQLLKSEIEANITGGDPFDELIEWFADKPSLSSYLDKLLRIKRDLVKLDEELGHGDGKYETLYLDLDTLGIKYDKKFLVQTDVLKPAAKATLSSQIIDEINDCLDFLMKVNLAGGSGDGALSDFVKSFSERYEEEPVPLLLALDCDIGVGFPVNAGLLMENPLLKGLTPPARIEGFEFRLSLIDGVVLNKVIQSLRQGGNVREITLTDADFDFPGLKGNAERSIPATISVFCKIFKGEEPTILIKSSPGGANRLLGRFCYLDDAVDNLAKKISAKEQELSDDKVFRAEIVHLPESRIGNISSHPFLRNLEVHYLARSGKPMNKLAASLPASDLMLKMERGRLVLFSASTGKRIKPMLSDAHNYSLRTTPVYQFLCHYQSYEETNLYSSFSDNLLNVTGYMPLVRYGKCSWKP